MKYNHVSVFAFASLCLWILSFPEASGQLLQDTTPSKQVFSFANKISLGTRHSCALKQDGTVWCWGNNEHGELGNTSTENQSKPTQVRLRNDVRLFQQEENPKIFEENKAVSNINVLTGIKDLGSGAFHTCALKVDGTVWCWGSNWGGQLGDGTNDNHPYAVQVQGLTDAKVLGGGSEHACVAKTDGTLWCWGANIYGQLGIGSDTWKDHPVQVSDIAQVTDISTGGAEHTCALKANGTVWCWGQNSFGQLGTGNTTHMQLPVKVSGLSNVMAMDSGPAHTCAVKTDGTVWCWGYNKYGQLGDGTKIERHQPVQVAGLTEVEDIAVEGYNSCALKTNGNIRCWGYNKDGELGDGTNTDNPNDVKASGFSDGGGVDIGMIHTCAFKSDRSFWCWGSNDYGQLGDGTNHARSVPNEVAFP